VRSYPPDPILRVHSVKTRLQVQVRSKKTGGIPLTTDDQHYHSAFDAISKIVAQEGISGLYNGLGGSLLGVASTNFAYFYWYSVVRTAYTKYRNTALPPSTPAELSLGAIAGALAQLFTIPVAVITARQQTQPRGDRKGIIETGREVVNSEDGWTGLWRGLKASLVLVVNPSITYGAYQRLRVMLYPGRTSLRPSEAFRTSSIPHLYPIHIPDLPLTSPSSPRRSLQSPRNNSHPTPHRRQSRSPIPTPTSP